MKLEVGMYCYNKTNRKLGIGKIISFQRNNNVNIKYKNDIELVSVGNFLEQTCINADDDVYYETLRVEDIKDIVTKEQFDSMKYEVDSNE